MPTALIVGGAATVFDDMKRAQALFTPDLIVAVNDIGVALDKLDHWVTYHPMKFIQWVKRRERLRLPPAKLWAHKAYSNLGIPSYRTVTQAHWGGSSGLLGVQVAIEELHCERIVIAGIPMTETPHFDRHPQKNWPEAFHYRARWEERIPLLKKSVRSVSGWTMEILGAPTVEWFVVEGAVT